MKKVSLITLLAVMIYGGSFGQSQNVVDISQGSRLGRVQSSTNRPGNFLIPVPHLRLTTVNKEATKEAIDLDKKKYLNYNYDLASVDNYDTKAYVRYNIYDDQIEFVKDESIYYLAKEAGRQVSFVSTKDLYRVYDFNNDLQYFKVHVDGKNALIAKQKVRYVDAKVAVTGYDIAKPANYKRMKDELYLALGNKTLVKLPKKKKDFFKSFGDKADQIKAYAKENKLGYKRIDDIKKLVSYFNTL